MGEKEAEVNSTDESRPQMAPCVSAPSKELWRPSVRPKWPSGPPWVLGEVSCRGFRPDAERTGRDPWVAPDHVPAEVCGPRRAAVAVTICVAI